MTVVKSGVPSAPDVHNALTTPPYYCLLDQIKTTIFAYVVGELVSVILQLDPADSKRKQQLRSLNDLESYADNRMEMLEHLGIDATPVPVQGSKFSREQEMRARTLGRRDTVSRAASLVLRWFPHLDPTGVVMYPFEHLDLEPLDCLQRLVKRIAYFANSSHGMRLLRSLRA